MEVKQIHFLGGMYRSGGTLLSALLNQHPKIYSSPLSPMAEYLWSCHQANKRSEDVMRNPDKERFTNMMNNMIQSYYSDVSKPIVFDRQKMWTTSPNFEVIRTYITKTPKVVYTYRSLLEILASLELMFKDVARFNNDIVSNEFTPVYYLSESDYRCEFFMESSGYIQRTLSALHTLTQLSNLPYVHFVSYDDLVKNTQKTLDSIYDFIKVERYSNDLFSIEKVEKDEVEPLEGPQRLHDISPTIVRSSTKPEDVLSKYIVNKYSSVSDYWNERIERAIDRQRELNVRH